jgi:hypothetical protein
VDIIKKYATIRDIYQSVIFLFIINTGLGLHLAIMDNDPLSLLTSILFIFAIHIIVFLIFILTFALSDKVRLRWLCSWTYISKYGIRNVCIGAADIALQWNECSEISVGIFRFGRFSQYNAICFSKKLLSHKQLQRLQDVPICGDYIWIQYSNSLCKELMRYIDITKITNYHLIEKRVEKIKRKIAK